MTDQELWERWPDETDAAWFAFQIYRDMPYTEAAQPRSKVGAYKIWHDRKGKVRKGRIDSVPGMWNIWEIDNEWRRRVLAYDSYLDRLKQDRRRREIEEAEKRHADTAKAILGIAIKRLKSINPELLTPSQALRYAEIAIRTERLVLGETTENVGLTERPIDTIEVVVPEGLEGEELDDDFID